MTSDSTEIRRLLMEEISSWRGMTNPVSPWQIDWCAQRIESILASPSGQEAPPTLRAAARGVVKEWESNADDDRYAVRLAVNISKLKLALQEPSSGLPPVDVQEKRTTRQEFCDEAADMRARKVPDQ